MYVSMAVLPPSTSWRSGSPLGPLCTRKVSDCPERKSEAVKAHGLSYSPFKLMTSLIVSRFTCCCLLLERCQGGFRLDRATKWEVLGGFWRGVGDCRRFSFTSVYTFESVRDQDVIPSLYVACGDLCCLAAFRYALQPCDRQQAFFLAPYHHNSTTQHNIRLCPCERLQHDDGCGCSARRKN